MAEPALTIGHAAEGRPVALQLDRLIGSHAGIVANSGAGKSGLLRRILETTHGRVQHIVFDPEDEFYSLRERFSYVIAGGEGGDIPATIAGAAALARATLEHGFSLIVQLNDLGGNAPEFVAGFLQGLMSAPRETWRPVLIPIDEAQRFVPSGGAGTAASAAVRDLLFRGRKRGFTAIVASLRISLIDPGVRGMCNNWLLGRVGQALDRNLMADQLGFTAKEGRDRLRAIEERHFYGFGPAIAAEPVLFRVDDVQTTPVRAGQAKVPTPPAPDALRKILAGLPAPAPAQDPSIPAGPIEAYRAGAAAGEMLLERDRRIEELESELSRARTDLARLEKRARRLSLAAVGAVNLLQAVTAGQADIETGETPGEPAPEARMTSAPSKRGLKGRATGKEAPSSDEAIPPGTRPTLAILAEVYPHGLDRALLAMRVGIKPKGTTFSSYLSRLRMAALIEERDGKVFAVERARALVGEVETPPAPGPELARWWGRKLPGTAAMVEHLIGRDWAERREVADALNINPSGTTLSSYISRLSTAGVIEKDGSKIRLHPQLAGDR